jgi:uncharacterized protein (TIGR02271 family)
MTDQQTGEVLPLLKEEVRVEKRSLITGKVRVRSVVDTVEEVARAVLEEERVEVTRVPVNKEVDAAPSVRTEGDLTIVPVLEEVLVVEKRLVLKEELHIRRQVAREDVEVPVTLRKQRAVIERLTTDGHPILTDEDNA